MAQGTVISKLRLIDEDGNAVGIEEVDPLIMDSLRIRQDLNAINESLRRLIQLIERGF